METTLLIVRHGESLGNLEERFLGHTDLGLSELGERQAAALTAALRGRHIDAVYSSDLCRASMTVAGAAAERGLAVIPERGLREIFAGDWENRKFDELITLWPSERHLWKFDIGNACPPNGERVSEVYDRVYRTLLAIAEENPGKTLLIGTHATPIRAITARLMGLGVLGMKDLAWAKNASVTTVLFKDGRFTLLCEADASHLRGVSCEPPSKI